MLEIGAVCEVSAVFGRAANAGVMQARTIGLDGSCVMTRGNIHLPMDDAFSTGLLKVGSLTRFDLVFILSGDDLSEAERERACAILRWCQISSIPVCVTGAVVEDVARMGLAKAIVAHWSQAAAMNEAASRVAIHQTLYEQHRNVATCAGEVALLDYLLDFVEARSGGVIASRVARFLVMDSPRSGGRPQPSCSTDRRRNVPKQLKLAIDYMEANLEEEIKSPQIAVAAGISTRQLERLFARHMDQTPTQFLRNLRLDRVLSLLDSTRLSVMEVAIASGFSNYSSFSKRFHERFGVRPSSFRKQSARLQ